MRTQNKLRLTARGELVKDLAAGILALIILPIVGAAVIWMLLP